MSDTIATDQYVYPRGVKIQQSQLQEYLEFNSLQYEIQALQTLQLQSKNNDPNFQLNFEKKLTFKQQEDGQPIILQNEEDEFMFEHKKQNKILEQQYFEDILNNETILQQKRFQSIIQSKIYEKDIQNLKQKSQNDKKFYQERKIEETKMFRGILNQGTLINEEREKLEKEEERIANLKKCIHFALNVQVTKSVIEKCQDALDLINVLVKENSEFIIIYQSLYQAKQAKPIKITPSNVEKYIQDFPQLKLLFLQKYNVKNNIQQSIIAEKVNNLLPAHPCEININNLLLETFINYKREYSGYQEFKLQLKKFEHSNSHILYGYRDENIHFKYLKNNLISKFKLLEEYKIAMKNYETQYYEIQNFQRFKRVVYQLFDKNPDFNCIRYSQIFHKNIQSLKNSDRNKIKIAIEYQCISNKSSPPKKCFQRILDFKVKQKGEQQKAHECELIQSVQILKLIEMYYKMLYEAKFCTDPFFCQLISEQYSHIQIEIDDNFTDDFSFTKQSKKSIKMNCLVSGFLKITIIIDFFSNEIENDNQQQENQFGVHQIFTSKILKKTITKLYENSCLPNQLLQMSWIVSQQIVNHIIVNDLFSHFSFKIQKRMNNFSLKNRTIEIDNMGFGFSIESNQRNLPQDLSDCGTWGDAFNSPQKVEWDIQAKNYFQDKYFYQQVTNEQTKKKFSDLGSIFEKYKSEFQIGENFQEQICQKPLIQNQYFCKIVLMKSGFQFMLQYPIVDDICKEIDQTILINQNQILPSAQFIQSLANLKISQKNKKNVQDEIKMMKLLSQKTIEETSSFLIVQSYDQLDQIAKDNIQFL